MGFVRKTHCDANCFFKGSPQKKRMWWGFSGGIGPSRRARHYRMKNAALFKADREAVWRSYT